MVQNTQLRNLPLRYGAHHEVITTPRCATGYHELYASITAVFMIVVEGILLQKGSIHWWKNLLEGSAWRDIY
jgi:hypothetical protein